MFYKQRFLALTYLFINSMRATYTNDTPNFDHR